MRDGSIPSGTQDGATLGKGLFCEVGRAVRAAGSDHRLSQFLRASLERFFREYPSHQPAQFLWRAVTERGPQPHAGVRDPRPHCRLIDASRQGHHGHAAAECFEHRIHTRVRDQQRRLVEQRQLRREVHHERVVRHRA